MSFLVKIMGDNCVTPINTQTYPLDDTVEAFRTAKNCKKDVNVQLKVCVGEALIKMIVQALH
jgi:hypothetical protein